MVFTDPLLKDLTDLAKFLITSLKVDIIVRETNFYRVFLLFGLLLDLIKIQYIRVVRKQHTGLIQTF